MTSTRARSPGLSVRLKLTLSYTAFLLAAALLVLVVGYLFLEHTRHVGIVFIADGRRAVLRAIAPTVLLIVVVLLTFGLVGGWFLAGRMLAPLSRITEVTRRVGAGSLSHRIGLDGRRDEFRDLADAFDTMLGRLETQVAEQQRFAANASHELRTPLAITRTLLEVAARDHDRDHGELMAELHTVNNRAIDLTEALLLLSRAERQAFELEIVDLSLLAEEATETLFPLAQQRSVSIEVVGDVAPTIGSSPLLLQLITNLVHNGIVHNLGGGGTVRVATSVEPAGSVVRVESTGPPLGAESVVRLAEPFQRGAGRVRSDHGGVGLGLAIVESIARAHDGSLALTRRDEGGLIAEVRLPVGS